VGFTQLNNNLAVVEISFEKQFQSIQCLNTTLIYNTMTSLGENEVNFKEFESCLPIVISPNAILSQ
jgi:hypothetical protein